MFFQRKEKGSLPKCILRDHKKQYGRASLNASLTVEAACVVPVFLYLMIGILSFLNVIGNAQETACTLHERAKELAVLSYATEGAGLKENEMVDLVAVKYFKSQVPFLSFGNPCYVQRACVRAWTGHDAAKDAEDGEDTADTYVYVTPNGSVYHKSTDCSYLKLSVRSVSLAAAKRMRSLDGSIYYACSCCRGFKGASVYITSYGVRYHARLNCYGLKRTIKRVPLTEVKNMKACSKCG